MQRNKNSQAKRSQARKSRSRNSQLVRLVGLEAAVAATGLVGCVAAVAAPGDLDPSFGDVGRQRIETSWFSTLWSVDLQDDDSILYGGGGEYDYYDSYEDFVGLLLSNGTPDAGFAAAALADTTVYDTALQADGKVVGVGMARQPDGRKKLLVFRLRPDGSLDPDFGLGGQVLVSDGTTSREAAYRVFVDTDGRIVVAGQRSSSLLVARLLPNGTLDAGFGTAGLYVGLPVIGTQVRIAAAPAGGYRVMGNFYRDITAPDAECGVVGLTDAGVLDAAYGSGGYATPRDAGGIPYDCSSMFVQADGRVVLGGRDNEANGYVGRLLANGAIDPSFPAGVVPSRFKQVSALAAGGAGSVYVAGIDRTGFSGAVVIRMLADGTLDTSYGRAGATLVALQRRRAAAPVINDMKATASGGLAVGGSYYDYYYGGGAFVARLLGDASAGGPGVLGIKQWKALGTEQSGQVVIAVQRTGGSAGPVAVSYSTRDFPQPPAAGSEFAPGALANAGTDYTSSTGRLTWADGDASEREIIVPIANDTTAEVPEFFEVVLESPEGGAGLAAFGADLEVAGATYPFGEFSIAAGSTVVTEFGQADFYVGRNDYGQGAVSVTVRVAAGGSATPGVDFRNGGSTTWQDVVLTWADGEIGQKYVPVQIVNGDATEAAETFTLELVSPTGGAALGDATQATVQIAAQSAPSTPRRGGGGFGWLSMLLLGLWGVIRRRKGGATA